MSQPDRAGTYRGVVKEHGVSATSKNNYPQWVARMACDKLHVGVGTPDAAEWESNGYTPDADGWVDVSELGWSTTGYFVLFNAEKALLNYDQVIAATGWDGASFVDLDGLDLTEHVVQFRIEEDTYQGETKLKVQWIDEVGAPVDRELKSFDDGELKALDSKFRGMLKKKPKAAPVGASKKTTPQKAAPAKSAPPAKKQSAPPKQEAADAPPAAGMTKEAAWEAVQTGAGLDDDAMADAWISACEATAPDKDEEAFTPEDWASVARTVLGDNCPF